MTIERQAQVLGEVAERVALLNEFRTDGFQDDVARIVNDAREHWRGGGHDLPRIGSDTLYDALTGMAEVADGSPMAVRDACAAALRVAEDVRAAR